MSDALFIRDPELFFQVVRTTGSTLEAEDMLRRAQTSLSAQIQEHRRHRTGNEMELNELMSRVKTELHYICTVRKEVTWQRAVKAVCGYQAYHDCVSWIRAMERNGGIN